MRLLFLLSLLASVGCTRALAPPPPAPPPPSEPEPERIDPPATVSVAEAPACELTSTLLIRHPDGPPSSSMMLPSYGSAEEPSVATIPDHVVAGKKPPEQIAAAIASVLDSDVSKIEVVPKSDGSYRVHVRAQVNQFATCHGRYDRMDLTGIAKIVDGSIDLELAGPDRIIEDVCNASGRGRDVVARRHATASFRIAKRCSGS